MNTGVGFSEMLVVLTLILVFFGSKELPMFIRKAAQAMAKVRRYSEKFKSELDSISRTIDEPVAKIASSAEKKQQLRTQYLTLRKNMAPDERMKKSEEIFEHLKAAEEYKKATAVMIYVNTANEVSTREMIRQMLEGGKRVVVPYCPENGTSLGLAEIRDMNQDLISGAMGVAEPRKELRNRFFRSDLQLIICPGVAFDLNGGRLGRGKAYYDIFLRELRGNVPVIGLAFDCQICKEQLPFEYHDVPMDQVITESGLLIKKDALLSPQTPSGAPAG